MARSPTALHARAVTSTLSRFVLALVLVGCASEPPAPAPTATITEEPAPMPSRNKQDALPPVFLDGPPIAPEDELLRWIAAREAQEPRATFRLPFTWAAGEVNRATLGVGPGGKAYRLSDSALGIPLEERLRQLRRQDPGAEGGPVSAWLSVRLGALLPEPEPAPDAPPLLSVLAVHERIPDGTTGLRAQAVRRTDDLVIKGMGKLHCARGSKRCERCKAAEAEPATPALLDLRPDDPQAARPTVEVVRAGETTHRVYDVVRRFASADEARAFGAKHGVDVQLGR